MITVTAGVPSDRDALTAVVAAALVDDPLMAWLLAGVDDREEATRQWWAPLVAGYLAANRALVAGDGAACLFWRHSSERIPDAPGQPPIGEVIERLVTPSRLPEVGVALGQLPRLRPPEPYVHVHVLATRPDRQGHGLGARLLAKLVALAAETTCCLESTNPRNHPFYLRSGLVAGRATTLPASDVTATAFASQANIAAFDARPGVTPAGPGWHAPPMASTDSDPGEGWYFNVITKKVEHHDRSKGSDLLGPYPDEATAGRALEIARERTRRADAEDAAWEEG